jgi:hypothetical protein
MLLPALHPNYFGYSFRQIGYALSGFPGRNQGSFPLRTVVVFYAF